MALQGPVFERRRDMLRWLFGNVDATPTAMAAAHCALWTNDPGDSATPGGTEVTGTGYARQSIGVGTANWTSGGSATNPATMVTDNAINFGTVGAGGWGTASWVTIMSASTSGNLEWRIPITSPAVPVTLSAGATVSIAAGSLQANMTFGT